MPFCADENRLTGRIIESGIKVHRFFGPGLLEQAYRQPLAYELSKGGLQVKVEWPIPVRYENVTLNCGFRADLLVEDSVIVEVKSVDRLAPIHTAQMLTYLRLTGCKVGLLMNFNVDVLTRGIRRVVNNFPEGISENASPASDPSATPDTSD